jgi:nicotinamidase-related amidase
MKEVYFTPETIEARGNDLLEYCHARRERRPADALRPEQAALLVLDMQNYFLQPDSHAFIPSAPAVLPQVERLVKAFQRFERPVVFTRHLNTPADAGQMAQWWRDLLDPVSPLSQIVPTLDPAQACLFEKSQYDAFYQTGLEDYLRSQQVKQVVVSGVMTHLCCETTARSAFVHGYQVFFAIDATASYTEAFHRASLLNLSHGFAVPVLTREIVSVFDA